MPQPWQELKATWSELGQADPLWAVASTPEARGGRWDVAQFLASGDADVARYRRLLSDHAAAPEYFAHVLDFGCGVGRLSQAWARYAGQVTGVDVSAPMIAKGRELIGAATHVRLLVNEAPDLSSFPSDSFDLVFSHICLQHMPWPLAAGYVREFARVCQPGGWVAFQQPAYPLRSLALQRCRKFVIDHLPFGLARRYRQWRHGCPVVFDMYFAPPEAVTTVAADAGLQLLHQEADPSAGERIRSFVYLFNKPLRPAAASASPRAAS